MKNLLKTIIGLAIVTTLYTACSKDPDSAKIDTPVVPEETATITIDSPAFNITKNSIDIMVVKFRATPYTGTKIKKVTVFRSKLNSTESTIVYTDSSLNLLDSTSINRRFENQVVNSDTGKYVFVINVTGSNGKVATKTSPVFTLIANKSNINPTGQFTIGGSGNFTGGSFDYKFAGLNENFPNGIELFKDKTGPTSSPPVTPSKADSLVRARFNSSRIDFVFSASSLTTILSPDTAFTDVDWATEVNTWAKPLNKTIFVATDISASQYAADDFTVEPLINALDFTKKPLVVVKNLQNAVVVGFKTASGKKGLIYMERVFAGKSTFGTFSIKWKK